MVGAGRPELVEAEAVAGDAPPRRAPRPPLLSLQRIARGPPHRRSSPTNGSPRDQDPRQQGHQNDNTPANRHASDRLPASIARPRKPAAAARVCPRSSSATTHARYTFQAFRGERPPNPIPASWVRREGGPEGPLTRTRCWRVPSSALTRSDGAAYGSTFTKRDDVQSPRWTLRRSILRARRRARSERQQTRSRVSLPRSRSSRAWLEQSGIH